MLYVGPGLASPSGCTAGSGRAGGGAQEAGQDGSQRVMGSEGNKRRNKTDQGVSVPQAHEVWLEKTVLSLFKQSEV